MKPTIALIAHENQKDAMVAFVSKYAPLLSRYRLIATGNTGQRIQDRTQLLVERKLSGALGGDAQIAAEIAIGGVVAVIFLIDSLYAQPHEPNIQTFLRLCQVHDVALAVNLATAEAIAAGLRSTHVAHLIFNPVSGQGNPDQALAQIKAILEPQMHVAVHFTSPEESAEQLAKEAIEANADLIIASGGDGTVSAVAGSVIGTNIPLGVIPRGTANAFSVALGIPTGLQAACENILAGVTRVVDAALCNGAPMILLAGIGFEAETVERANRESKDRLGVLAYILAGAQQLREQQSFSTQIEVDGEINEFQASAITIANAAPSSSVLAQGFGLVDAHDGLLEVTIAAPNTMTQAITAMFHLWSASLIKATPNREDIIGLRTNRIKVTTDPPQKVVVDGELIGTTPVEIECIPDGLTVIIPAAIASEVQPQVTENATP